MSLNPISNVTIRLQWEAEHQIAITINCTHLKLESRSSPDKPLFHLLLHCPEVVLNARSFAYFQWVVAVGKNDWLQVSFRVEVNEMCWTCISDINSMCFQSAHNTTYLHCHNEHCFSATTHSLNITPLANYTVYSITTFS